ncbi:hypothetical protein DYB32_008294 [Aphanomyces invadans]|uniref:Cation-transporting P-type ATPase N-terminal domain-containing protein n=1 Tax=Aphanomyces invadans TaxID=157072 RepID=A0A418ALN1_9STRA|nr:hypothetical protein DYB32_008294 [Aphanomyces invadans]
MHECAVVHSEGGMVRTFEWKHQRYLYIQQSGSFERGSCMLAWRRHVMLPLVVPAMLLDSLESVTRSLQTGLASSVVADRTAFYGPNTMELKTPSLIRLLVEKVVHPFYLFQLISVALWLEEAYTTYALAILAMSISSIAYEVHSQVTNASQMQALVACAIQVQVGCRWQDNVSMHVQKNQLMCDGVVAISTNSVWAVVTRVGFSTTKGDLLRQILYPDDVPFQMVTDSYRYLLALSIVAGLTSLQRIYDAYACPSSFAPPLDMADDVWRA